MDRREFLKLIGITSVAVAVAPQVLLEAPLEVVTSAPVIATPTVTGIRGLPYLITSSGTYLGIDRMGGIYDKNDV